MQKGNGWQNPVYAWMMWKFSYKHNWNPTQLKSASDNRKSHATRLPMRCVCNWQNSLSIRKSTESTLNLRPISDCNFSNTTFSISHLSTVAGGPPLWLTRFLFDTTRDRCSHSIPITLLFLDEMTLMTLFLDIRLTSAKFIRFNLTFLHVC